MFYQRLVAAAGLLAALASASSAAAAGASHTTAPSIADGFVSVAGGGAVFDYEDGSSQTARGLSVEGMASGSYQFSTTLGFQGDAVFRSQGITFDGQTYGYTDRSFDGALHAFYRDEAYLLGGFAQLGTDQITVDGSSLGASLDRAYAGAEGQAFLGNFTVYGQVAGERLTEGGMSVATGFLGNAEVRYFLTPNLKIEAHVGDEHLSVDSSSYSIDIAKAGIGAEYRLDDKPFSLFAKYDFARETASGSSGSLTDNRLLVGVKFNFGTDTLFNRDRSGASLKPVESGLTLFGLPS